MHLYFAAASSESNIRALRAEGAKRALTPYPVLRKNPRLLELLDGMDVFLDSGAWSVFTGNEPPIDVDEYARWVRACSFPFKIVSSLDVLGDLAASRRNYDHLRDSGLDVLPVWHADEPPEAAGEYAADAPYLALGSLASRPTDEQLATIGGAWPLVRHRQTHLFGVCRTRVLLTYPPTSADTASWTIGAARGAVFSLRSWPRSCSVLDITPRCQDWRPKTAAALTAEMRRFGSSWKELSEGSEARQRYNVRILHELERRLTALEVVRATAAQGAASATVPA